MTSQSAPVIPFPNRGTRSWSAIRADLAGLLREVDVLIAAEGGGAQAPASPPAHYEDVLSLAKAAYEIGWPEQRLRKHIVRQSKLPASERFAWQPGGVKNAPWRVDMVKLRRYVRNLTSGEG